MKHTKKMAISTPLSLMAIFFFLISTQVQAYRFTDDFRKGFYWSSFPIQMNKFSPVQSDSPMLERLTNQAVAEWENAVGRDIWNFSPVQTTTNYTGNYIRWSDSFASETGYDPSRTLAVTIRYNRGTHFERTVIILNGSNQMLRQNYGGMLYATILHEIGHTLGLDHSEDAYALMAASLSGVRSLNYDDIQGINAIVDETLSRQSRGYVSPYSTSEEKVAACGSVAFISSGGGSGGNGVVNFLGSLLIGIAAIALGKKLNQSKTIKYSQRA